MVYREGIRQGYQPPAIASYAGICAGRGYAVYPRFQPFGAVYIGPLEDGGTATKQGRASCEQ